MALRSVMLKYGSITPEVTGVLGPAIMTSVVESDSTNSHAATIASNILRPALAELREDRSVEWGLTAGDVADVLRQTGYSIRGGVLEVLAEWLRNDNVGGHEAWNSIGIPFFERVWPRERAFLDASLTPHLIDLAIATGDGFPVVLGVLQPYFSPCDGEYGSLYSISKSEVPEQFPVETLDLLWLVCGPKSRGRFHDIPEIIDRMVAAEPSIEVDRRLQWLEQNAERYD